jgi:hypothetical protein
MFNIRAEQFKVIQEGFRFQRALRFVTVLRGIEASLLPTDDTSAVNHVYDLLTAAAKIDILDERDSLRFVAFFCLQIAGKIDCVALALADDNWDSARRMDFLYQYVLPNITIDSVLKDLLQAL